MGDSPQLAAFNELYKVLHTGIRAGVSSVANDAYGRGLIDDAQLNTCTTFGLPQDMATNYLLQPIRDAIKTDPAKVYVFIDILKEDASRVHLAKELREAVDRHIKVSKAAQRTVGATQEKQAQKQ